MIGILPSDPTKAREEQDSLENRVGSAATVVQVLHGICSSAIILLAILSKLLCFLCCEVTSTDYLLLSFHNTFVLLFRFLFRGVERIHMKEDARDRSRISVADVS